MFKQFITKTSVTRHTLLSFRTICLVTLSVCNSAKAGSLDDSQILGIYIQVNSFDIETALLGRAQAHSPDARQLAEHVSSDHLKVREAAYNLAEKCKVVVTLPAERDAVAIEHDKMMAKLNAFKGAAFDQAFLEYEVSFHRAAIDAVRTVLLPAATCPDLQMHLKGILPAFEHHLMHTEELAHKLTTHQ